MNRLTGITLSRPAGQDLACAVTYDALGRMTSKQAVTAVNGVAQVSAVFSQPVFNATKVHAVSSAQSMSDMFPTGTQNVTYTSFDKANKIKLGMDSICYTYGYDQQRIGMEEYLGSSVRTKQYVGSCEYITETGTSGTKTLTYLTGPYGVFAVVERQNNAETLHYILKDNLGSWTTITNGNGAVEQRLSFDAWGNQRNPNTWANYTANDTYSKPMLDRGFTGHEHYDRFKVVNANARLYDPVIGRFFSPDPFVQAPDFTQNYNRYSYCMNNPVMYSDPDGEFFIVDSWIVGFVSKFFQTGSLKQSWQEANKRAGNDVKLWGGLLVTDENKSFWGRTWEFFSRLTWQAPQTIVGWFVAEAVILLVLRVVLNPLTINLEPRLPVLTMETGEL